VVATIPCLKHGPLLARGTRVNWQAGDQPSNGAPAPLGSRFAGIFDKRTYNTPEYDSIIL
jgi:hypothetical protein